MRFPPAVISPGDRAAFVAYCNEQLRLGPSDRAFRDLQSILDFPRWLFSADGRIWMPFLGLIAFTFGLRTWRGRRVVRASWDDVAPAAAFEAFVSFLFSGFMAFVWILTDADSMAVVARRSAMLVALPALVEVAYTLYVVRRAAAASRSTPPALPRSLPR